MYFFLLSLLLGGSCALQGASTKHDLNLLYNSLFQLSYQQNVYWAFVRQTFRQQYKERRLSTLIHDLSNNMYTLFPTKQLIKDIEAKYLEAKELVLGLSNAVIKQPIKEIIEISVPLYNVALELLESRLDFKLNKTQSKEQLEKLWQEENERFNKEHPELLVHKLGLSITNILVLHNVFKKEYQTSPKELRENLSQQEKDLVKRVKAILDFNLRLASPEELQNLKKPLTSTSEALQDMGIQ